MINKKIIVVSVILCLVILVAVLLLLIELIDAKGRAAKFKGMLDRSTNRNIVLNGKNATLEKENEFLRMLLNEYDVNVPLKSFAINEDGFWAIKLAYYDTETKNGSAALNEVLMNVFIKNKMFDVFFRRKNNSMTLYYGRYSTQIEAMEQLNKLRALHKDFAKCKAEEFIREYGDPIPNPKPE